MDVIKNSVGSRRNDPNIRAAFDRAVLRYLRPGSLWLAVLYLVFALAHLIVLPQPAGARMAWIAAVSALALAVLHIAGRRAVPPLHWAHPVAFGVCGLVLFNCLAHIAIVRVPRETTNLVLLMIGASCVLLSWAWLVPLLALAYAGWWLITWQIDPQLAAGPVEFNLLSAGALAAIIQSARQHTHRQLEQWRMRDAERSLELEKALDQAKSELRFRTEIEAELHRIHAELECRVEQRTAELARANDALQHEISSRAEAEDLLRKSRASLLMSQKLAQVGSWELDLASGRIQCSEELPAIFGYPPGQFVPSREFILEHIPPNQRETMRQAFLQAMERKGDYSIDYSFIRPDRAERLITEYGQFVRDESGKPVQLIAVFQDITDRSHLEAQLRQSQKMEAIGQLAAGVAHDFNNILTVIKGNTGLLIDFLKQESSRLDIVRQISHAADRASNLTRQLLLFSRRQMMQAHPIDLNEVISNLHRMLVRVLGEHIVIEIRPGSAIPAVHADAGMVEQAILNLAVNARDAMPKGGLLSITTDAVQIGPEAMTRNPEARPGLFAQITVTDTGAGIPPEILPRIFEPFFTTKGPGEGTGLGLSTLYGIVKQHKGWVEVASELDRGTTVRLLFPAVDLPARPAATPAQTESIPRGSETILVVEDEQTVRDLTCKLLRNHGYSVLEAESGPDALGVWRQHSAEIKLLITDLIMPGGVSGKELAEQLTRDKPDLKTIYVSGYSTDFLNITPHLEKGFRFIAKPFPGAALARAVRECLDSR